MSSFHIDPTITVTTKHKTVSLRISLLMLIAIVGSVCTCAVCISMIRPDYKTGVFWSVTVFSAALSCILNNMPGKLKLTGFIPLAAGIVAGLIKMEQVVLGAKLFYNSCYSIAHKTDTQYFILDNIESPEISVTWFMCCSSVIISSLIAVFLIRKTYFIPYFLLTFIPVEIGLYEGLSMNITAMFILVATWLGVLAIQLAGQHGQNPGGNRVRAGNIANCGIAAIAITSATIITAVAITNYYDLTTDENIQEKRRDMRTHIEDFRIEDLKQTLQNFAITLGIFEDPDTRELGTKNKLEYKERDEVEITFTEIPEHSMYLKNFTGSVYENNKWSILPDEVWEENVKLDTLFEKFECVPQILPFMSNQASTSDNNGIITIEPIIKTNDVIQPYAAYGEGFTYKYDTGCYINDDENYEFIFSLDQDFSDESQMPINNYYIPSTGFNFSDKTTATFFEQLGVATSSESFCISSLNPPYINSEYTTQTLQASLAESYVYRPFVYENYLSTSSSEELAEVYASIPSDIVEISKNGNDIATLAAIRSYLAEQCEYTLAPGATPSTRDFVNYFLMENKKGYCMHYASAGTVIARYLGIPARYCEGYVVSTDMIENGKENSDGSVTVTLQDSSSHAWCEFYIDGYGWVPYELTPGYYDNEVSTEEDIQISDMSMTTTEIITDTQIETTETTTATTVTESYSNPTATTITQISGNNSVYNSSGFSSSLLKIIIIIVCFFAAAALIIAIILLTRKYHIDMRMRKFKNKNRIAGILYVYKFLMKILLHMGLSPENSQLLDFAASAREILNTKGFDGDGAQKVIALVLAADMGGKEPDIEDVNSSIKYVNTLAVSYGNSLGKYKRLILKYIFHLF